MSFHEEPLHFTTEDTYYESMYNTFGLSEPNTPSLLEGPFTPIPESLPQAPLEATSVFRHLGSVTVDVCILKCAVWQSKIENDGSFLATPQRGQTLNLENLCEDKTIYLQNLLFQVCLANNHLTISRGLVNSLQYFPRGCLP